MTRPVFPQIVAHSLRVNIDTLRRTRRGRGYFRSSSTQEKKHGKSTRMNVASMQYRGKVKQLGSLKETHARTRASNERITYFGRVPRLPYTVSDADFLRIHA